MSDIKTRLDVFCQWLKKYNEKIHHSPFDTKKSVLSIFKVFINKFYDKIIIFSYINIHLDYLNRFDHLVLYCLF